MARNRQETSPKKRDSFFKKPQKKFKPDFKNPQKAKNKPKYQSTVQYSAEESFKPSTRGDGDFFVKPTSSKVSEKPATDSSTGQVNKPEKKPFDKKKYRLQKYSKKYKLQQWEQKRKKAVLQGYYRSLKDDEPKLDVKSIYERHNDYLDNDDDNTDDKIDEENDNNLNANINQSTSENEGVPRNSKERKGKAFRRAYQEFQRIKEDKKKKKEEMVKRKTEREEALQAYKKKKLEKFKKLSRKTKRGQPIMKDRMELLLEKIQNSMNQ